MAVTKKHGSKAIMSEIKVISPILFLLGMVEFDGYLLQDAGAIWFADSNYFLDGDFRPDGGKNPNTKKKFFGWDLSYKVHKLNGYFGTYFSASS
jgi:hypothetical protein